MNSRRRKKYKILLVFKRVTDCHKSIWSLFSIQKMIKSFKGTTFTELRIPFNKMLLLNNPYYGTHHLLLMLQMLSFPHLTSKPENKRRRKPYIPNCEEHPQFHSANRFLENPAWNIEHNTEKKKKNQETSNPVSYVPFINVQETLHGLQIHFLLIPLPTSKVIKFIKSLQVIAAHLRQSKYSINCAFLITVIPSIHRI